MNFKKNNYFQEKFSKISVSGKTIKSREFEDCEFAGCRFLNCKFLSSILSAINPVDSSFIEIKFTKSKVIGFDWTKASKIRDLSFNDCQINDSNFRLLKLPGIKITNCEAKDVDFTEADLSEGNFKNTSFKESRFFKTNLTKANFKGAKDYQIDARHNTLKETHFSLPEALSLLNSLDIIID
jgi:fluoroquinolone resistance protein